MGWDLRTKNGYDLFEMSSMLQKAIRRSDIPHASYAANEIGMCQRKYLWKRLLTVSAEDCFGIMTKEIIALKEADEYVNKGKKDGFNDVFVAKAIVLMCMARKNRDADYVACNFMRSDRPLTDEEYEEFVDYQQVEELRIQSEDDVPDYVFDCHTRKGKMAGKTHMDMFKTENESLVPHQMSLFDMAGFQPYYDHHEMAGDLNGREMAQGRRYGEGREADPTHNGKDLKVPTEPNWGSYKMA